MDIVDNHDARLLLRMRGFSERLKHSEFSRQVNDIVEIGLRRYQDRYASMFLFSLPIIRKKAGMMGKAMWMENQIMQIFLRTI